MIWQMKVLLDECVDWRLGRVIVGHEVWSVQETGWSGIVNGALLRMASDNGFQIFITTDKNLRYQQNLKSFSLSTVVLTSPRSTLKYLRMLVPQLLQQISEMKSGEVYELQ